MLGVIASGLSAQDYESPDAKKDAARAAAEAYRELFKDIDALQNELGDSYDALLYPDSMIEPLEVSEEVHERLLNGVGEQLATVHQISRAPQVDWGMREDIEEKGPAALIPQVGPIRSIASQAKWFAQTTWDEDPERALDALLDAQAVGRHVNQEPTLITHLTQIACEGIALSGLTELSPKMSPAQRNRVLAGIETLPKAGDLAGALRNEHDLFVGWYKRKLLQEFDRWEDEKYGTSGFRFPEDLRLAGIVMLPGKPVRISLHNTRTNRTFWLGKGKEVDGIRLEEVDREKARAWIVHDGVKAVIDIAKESIESRYIPWEVLYSVFVRDDYKETGTSESEMKEALKEYGLTPENALDQFDAIDAFYSEAIQRLDDPIEDLKAWEQDKLNSYDENSLARMFLIPISKVVEIDKLSKQKYQMLALGFNIDSPKNAESQSIEYAGATYRIKPNEGGFTITPESSLGHPGEYVHSLHFGAPPPEPEN